jgi:hypothetical protein
MKGGASMTIIEWLLSLWRRRQKSKVARFRIEVQVLRVSRKGAT